MTVGCSAPELAGPYRGPPAASLACAIEYRDLERMEELRERLEKHVKRLEELAGPEHKAARQRIYRSIGKIKEALSKVRKS